jgi:hypothetical protein
MPHAWEKRSEHERGSVACVPPPPHDRNVWPGVPLLGRVRTPGEDLGRECLRRGEGVLALEQRNRFQREGMAICVLGMHLFFFTGYQVIDDVQNSSKPCP